MDHQLNNTAPKNERKRREWNKINNILYSLYGHAHAHTRHGLPFSPIVVVGFGAVLQPKKICYSVHIQGATMRL